MHCGVLLDTSSRFCPACGSHSPFGYSCPRCLHEVRREYEICPGCGRALYISCPHCGKRTFAQDSCEQCGKTLMVVCENKRCGVQQFFENAHCTACGKKIKAKLAR